MVNVSFIMFVMLILGTKGVQKDYEIYIDV